MERCDPTSTRSVDIHRLAGAETGDGTKRRDLQFVHEAPTDVEPGSGLAFRWRPPTLARMRIAVVGAGIVGLSVTYELVRAGYETDCFEAVAPMAARSCGDSRVFRLAHARPELVDLAHRAHRAWQDWSEAAGVQLVGGQGVVVGGDIAAIDAAMTDAGAPFEVTDAAPELPASAPVGPFLRDALGGVIQAAATGRFLLAGVGRWLRPQAVRGVGVDGGGAVLGVDDLRESRYDSVLVAAGAGTPELVGPVGIEVPRRLEHHLRATFPLRQVDAVPPCWLDRSHAWRPGFTSYGQLAAPGRWAIGGHVPDEDTAWELGRDEATARARRVLTDYAREYVTGCEPEILDTIYCTATVGLGDGMHAARVGPVLAVWGDNLFKFAPVLGRRLAQSVAELTAPDLLAPP